MSIVILVVALLIAFITGIWILLFSFGIKGVRSVQLAILVTIFLPYVFWKATSLFISEYQKKRRLSWFYKARLAFCSFFMCVLLIPIALSEGFTPAAELSIRKRKRAWLIKSKDKLCAALSNRVMEHYSVQHA